MTRRVQFQRSSVTGNIPSRLQAGTPAFNWADQRMWVGGPGDVPAFSIQKIDDWELNLVYREGDFAVYEGNLWRADKDIPANVGFREEEWTQFTDTESALIRQNTVTGLIVGGSTTLNDSRNIQVASGQGVVVNRQNPEQIVVTVVEWGGFAVNFSITPDNAREIERFLAIDSMGAAHFLTGTAAERRSHIFLGRILFENPALDITSLQDARTYSSRIVDAAEDLVREDTWLHKQWGCIIEPATGLQVTASEGEIRGRDWSSDPADPNTIPVGLRSPLSFNVARRGDPEYQTNQTDIPIEVDTPGGAVGLQAGEATIQRLFVDRDRNYTLVLGQETFSSVSLAVANLWRLQEFTFDAFGWDALIDKGAAEVAAIVITPEATDLSDVANARIVNVEGLDQRYAQVDAQDLSNFYRLDGANAITADLQMGGFALTNGFVDGVKAVIQPKTLTTTGAIPSTPGVRELQAQTADAKVFVETRVVADRIEAYDNNRAYRTDDACYSGNALYRCLDDTTPGDAPPSANWQAIGGGAGGGDAIITQPGADDRNEIDLEAAGDFVGLSITPNTSQTKDLARFGKAIVDRYGMGRGSFGGQVIRVAQASHGFSAVGQAASFANPNWVRSDASNDLTSARAIGVVHEVIDANNVDIQISGTVENLQPQAFVGGTIQVGQVYYVDAVSPGLLTNTPPAAPNTIDAVIYTISATEGVQLTSTIVGDPNSGTGGGSTNFAVVQPAHGWTAADVGRPLYLDEGDGLWKQAIANDLSTTGTAMLDDVLDANNITLTIGGYINDISATAFVGNVAPTAGKFYYVDQTESGKLTEIPPTSDQISNTLFLATGSTEGLVLPYERKPAPVAVGLLTSNEVSTNTWSVEQDDNGDLAIESSDGTKAIVENATPPTKGEALLTWDQAVNLLYPIGSIYSNGTTDENPATLLGFGTWAAYAQGRSMVGVGPSGTAHNWNWGLGDLNGNEAHALTEAEIPSHRHLADPPNTSTSTTGNHQHYTSHQGVEKGGDSSIVLAYPGQYGPIGPTNMYTSWAGNHSHTVNIPAFWTGYTGSGGSHLNIQPSIGTYHWIRTA